MRTKLFQIRTKPLIFTDKWPNTLKSNYYKNEFIKKNELSKH